MRAFFSKKIWRSWRLRAPWRPPYEPYRTGSKPGARPIRVRTRPSLVADSHRARCLTCILLTGPTQALHTASRHCNAHTTRRRLSVGGVPANAYLERDRPPDRRWRSPGGTAVEHGRSDDPIGRGAGQIFPLGQRYPLWSVSQVEVGIGYNIGDTSGDTLSWPGRNKLPVVLPRCYATWTRAKPGQLCGISVITRQRDIRLTPELRHMKEHLNSFHPSKGHQISIRGSCTVNDQPYVSYRNSLSSVGEKLSSYPVRRSMADSARAETRLKARPDRSRRPLAQLNTKERGLRAASECIKGTLSPRSAQLTLVWTGTA